MFRGKYLFCKICFMENSIRKNENLQGIDLSQAATAFYEETSLCRDQSFRLSRIHFFMNEFRFLVTTNDTETSRRLDLVWINPHFSEFDDVNLTAYSKIHTGEKARVVPGHHLLQKLASHLFAPLINTLSRTPNFYFRLQHGQDFITNKN